MSPLSQFLLSANQSTLLSPLFLSYFAKISISLISLDFISLAAGISLVSPAQRRRVSCQFSLMTTMKHFKCISKLIDELMCRRYSRVSRAHQDNPDIVYIFHISTYFTPFPVSFPALSPQIVQMLLHLPGIQRIFAVQSAYAVTRLHTIPLMSPLSRDKARKKKTSIT